MVTIKDKIEKILPKVLPESPENAINGPDLAEKIMPLLRESNEISVRQYLTVMHKDPHSVLGKVPGKHGYFKKEPAPKEDGEPEKKSGVKI